MCTGRNWTGIWAKVRQYKPREAERRKRMIEIKEEFYSVMTLETAYIYHEALGIEFVISDGKITVAEDSIKNAPQQ